MKIMDIFIAKNGEVLSNGTPYIRDECDNCYILIPVPSNYFDGQRVERVARVEPDKPPFDPYVCPECGQYRPDDERVKSGMKCLQCAYGYNL